MRKLIPLILLLLSLTFGAGGSPKKGNLIQLTPLKTLSQNYNEWAVKCTFPSHKWQQSTIR